MSEVLAWNTPVAEGEQVAAFVRLREGMSVAAGGTVELRQRPVGGLIRRLARWYSWTPVPTSATLRPLPSGRCVRKRFWDGGTIGASPRLLFVQGTD
jgi:hypothetical protein